MLTSGCYGRFWLTALRTSAVCCRGGSRRFRLGSYRRPRVSRLIGGKRGRGGLGQRNAGGRLIIGGRGLGFKGQRGLLGVVVRGVERLSRFVGRIAPDRRTPLLFPRSPTSSSSQRIPDSSKESAKQGSWDVRMDVPMEKGSGEKVNGFFIMRFLLSLYLRIVKS